jgi:hypothetical protein
MTSAAALTRLQGAYYVATGLWSLLHYRSFEAFTGRKREPWLVRSIGLLTVGIGFNLLRHSRSTPARELADLTATGFGLADLLAVSSGQRWVYLADAVLETSLVLARRVGQTSSTAPHPSAAEGNGDEGSERPPRPSQAEGER